jgi:hypothetical protein
MGIPQLILEAAQDPDLSIPERDWVEGVPRLISVRRSLAALMHVYSDRRLRRDVEPSMNSFIFCMDYRVLMRHWSSDLHARMAICRDQHVS